MSATLGIIAGGGRLPAQLVESCQAAGRACFVIILKGIASADDFQGVPHAVVRLGAVGEALDRLKAAGATTLVMAGKVTRPSLTSLFPDKTGQELLKHLGPAFLAGDDTLLRAAIRFVEGKGFTVIGVQDIRAELLAPGGVLGSIACDSQAERDIAQGIRTLQEMSPLDVGQAVVVRKGRVLGMEDVAGTNALIERCQALRAAERGGVLVKCRKIGQEERIDLPAIGPDTVQNAYEAGLSGIAIEADGGVIIDRKNTIALADKLGIFIVGVRE